MFQFLPDSGDIFHGYFIGRYRQRNSIGNFTGLSVPSNDIRDRRLMFQKGTPVSTIIRNGSTKLETLLHLHGLYAARVPTEKRAMRYIQSYKISLLSMYSNAQFHTFAKTAGSRTVIIRRSWGQFSAHKNGRAPDDESWAPTLRVAGRAYPVRKKEMTLVCSPCLRWRRAQGQRSTLWATREQIAHYAPSIGEHSLRGYWTSAGYPNCC